MNNVYMHILNMATRTSFIQDPATIRFLSEVAQALHDNIDISNIRSDDNQQAVHLLSGFIYKVDYGPNYEQHLAFLVESRGALGGLSELKETFVHLSNSLAVTALRNRKNHIAFVKSCLAYSEVTVPSVLNNKRRLNLYLETAEIALLGGFMSHADGLIDSAISCLEDIDRVDGVQGSHDLDAVATSICKLCSLIIAVPGHPEQGQVSISQRILLFLNAISWVSPSLKMKILCGLTLSLSASCQNLLPYCATHGKIVGDHHLFLGEDPTYLQEYLSLADVIVKHMEAVVPEEPSQATRGLLALEACNCLGAAFIANSETSTRCSKLLETAKSCLSANNKYLTSTLKFLYTSQPSMMQDE